MKLKILLPGQMLVDEQVVLVSAEAPDGSFTLLPGHIDFTSALVPGILTFRTPPAAADAPEAESGENFVAVDDGILVKKGAQILVATRHGVRSSRLEELHRTVLEQFVQRDQRERQARTVLARMESSFINRFIELE